MKFNNIHLYQFFSVTTEYRTHWPIEAKIRFIFLYIFSGSCNSLHFSYMAIKLLFYLPLKAYSLQEKQKKKYSGKDCIWLVHLFNEKANSIYIKCSYRFHEVVVRAVISNKMPYPPKNK